MNAVIQRLSRRRQRRRQKTSEDPPPRPGPTGSAPAVTTTTTTTTTTPVSNTNITSSNSISSSSNHSRGGGGGDTSWTMKNLQSFDGDDPERPFHHHEGSSSQPSSPTRCRRKNGVRRPEDPDPEKELAQVESITRAAAALDNAGNELFEKGDYDQAMANYVRALKLKRRSLQMAERNQVDSNTAATTTTTTNGSQPYRLDATAPDSANDSQHGGSCTSSRESLSSTASRRQSHEFLLASVATSLNNIGYLRQRTGEATTEESMACYQDALRIKQEVLGHDNLSFGKTLNNLASVHYLKKEFELAIDSYRKALYILEEHLGAFHLDVGTVYSNLGDVYWAQRDGPLAVEHYRRALEIRWYHLGEHDPKVVRLLEKIALIELKETTLNLDDSAVGPDGGYHDTDTDEDDEKDPTAPSRLLVQLHDQVEQDMTYVDDMKRKMAVLMVKDRLRVLRDMKNMDQASASTSTTEALPFEEESASNGSTAAASHGQPLPELPTTTTTTTTPAHYKFSPSERQQALDAVKQRLAKLRASRSDSSRSIMSNHPPTPELIRNTVTHGTDIRSATNTAEEDDDDDDNKKLSPVSPITAATEGCSDNELEDDDDENDEITHDDTQHEPTVAAPPVTSLSCC